MKNEILTKGSRLMHRMGFKIKQNSPEILMGIGIIGTIGSTIMACKATTKVKEIMDEKKKMIENVHSCLEDETVEYTEQDSKKDLTIIYTQTGIKIAKLYMPAILLETISIASIIKGHDILKKRNIALAAAYTVVDKGFKKYRENVIERFGDEVDKELRYSIKAKEIESKSVDENGNEVVEKETVKVMDGYSEASEYARFFDEFSSQYDRNASTEDHLMFIRRQQDYANDVLRIRGHLFLNEVYDMLGIPRTPSGCVVGWIYDENNPEYHNYVDFGIYNINREGNRLFVNGHERSVLLDFNVDGVVSDKL